MLTTKVSKCQGGKQNNSINSPSGPRAHSDKGGGKVCPSLLPFLGVSQCGSAQPTVHSTGLISDKCTASPWPDPGAPGELAVGGGGGGCPGETRPDSSSLLRTSWCALLWQIDLGVDQARGFFMQIIETDPTYWKIMSSLEN